MNELNEPAEYPGSGTTAPFSATPQISASAQLFDL
jgi:hypothetical protein